MKSPIQWAGIAMKLAACYYLSGACVTLANVMQVSEPNPHIHLGLFWLLVPILEPYWSILEVLLASHSQSSARIVEALWMLLLFAITFCFFFHFLGKAFSTNNKQSMPSSPDGRSGVDAKK